MNQFQEDQNKPDYWPPKNKLGKKWFIVLVIVLIIIVIAAIMVVILSQKRQALILSEIKPKFNQKEFTGNDQAAYVRPQRKGRLSFKINKKNLTLGGVFEVKILMDTLASNINVADVVIAYDPNILELVAVDDTKSVLPMLAIKKTDILGQVQIVRGSPGDKDYLDNDDGFTGQGLLASLKFKAINSGQTQIKFNPADSKLFLDDGRATKMILEYANLVIDIK